MKDEYPGMGIAVSVWALFALFWFVVWFSGPHTRSLPDMFEECQALCGVDLVRSVYEEKGCTCTDGTHFNWKEK